MNNIGPADVVGYLKEDGYVGVMTKAINPPKWLVEQRERDKSRVGYDAYPEWLKNGVGCEFGAEIALLEPSLNWKEIWALPNGTRVVDCSDSVGGLKKARSIRWDNGDVTRRSAVSDQEPTDVRRA